MRVIISELQTFTHRCRHISPEKPVKGRRIQLRVLRRNETKRSTSTSQSKIQLTTFTGPGPSRVAFVAACSSHAFVSLYTHHKTHLISVYRDGIRNLIWANDGNSSRNARYCGFVCVDRSGSWCCCALSGRFWTNFRAIVENTMGRRE